MSDDLSRPEREAVRLPMQWSSGANGGFSTAATGKLTVPVAPDGPFDAQRANVAEQQADPGSLLNWVRRLANARRECRAIGSSPYDIIATRAPGFLVLRFGTGDDAVVAVHNLSTDPGRVVLKPAFVPEPVCLIEQEARVRSTTRRWSVELGGYGCCWFRTSPAA